MTKKILTCFVALFLTVVAYAQQWSVTGVVTAADDGQPLPQLAIQIKGTQRGVVTDLDGKYSITVPSAETVLVFAYTGYETQEIRVGEQTTINVVMQTANEEIDQVVVVGYGTGRKISSTVGKLASVDQKKLQERPTANALDALAGQVAGLSVLTMGGEPSARASLTLHGAGSLKGNTEPLYVVDGIPVNSIAGLNSNDFERVDVLTDASATSIYGSRAANGVVYITTKQGRSTEESGNVNLRASYGVSMLASDKFYEDHLSTPEYYNFQKEIGRLTDAQVQSLRNTYGDNTFEWWKYVYNQYTPTHTADISFQGMSGATSYYVSGGYYYSQGLRQGSSYNRYNARINVNTKMKSWLRMGANTGLNYAETHTNQDGRTSDVGLVSSVRPYLSPYDANGNEIEGQKIPGTNMYSRSYIDKMRINWYTSPSLTASGYVSIEPLQGLTVKTQAGVEANAYHFYSRLLPSFAGDGAGRGSETERASTLSTITTTAEYRMTWREKHHITPLLGHEYIYGYTKTLFVSGTRMSDDRLLLLDNAKTFRGSSSWYENWYNSFFGRLEYDYDSRYFVDASLRNDASSRFGRDNRNAIFWSVGGMWKAKHERVLQTVRWLDRLDVKFSIGTSGNSSYPDLDWKENYLHQSLVQTFTPYKGNQTFTIGTAGNPDLTWEKQLKMTAGVAFGIFDFLRGDISFYRRLTSSMYLDKPVPYTTGFRELFSNVGTLSNTGIDIRLDAVVWHDAKGNNITPYITFNYNRQRIEELFGGRNYWVIPGSGVAYAKGHPVEFCFPRFYRVNPDDGKPQWYLPDKNDLSATQTNPNQVTSDFKSSLEQLTGKPVNAPMKGGFGFNADLMGFYVQCDFNFELGKWMFNNDRMWLTDPIAHELQNLSREVLTKKYWKQPGDIADFPSTQYSWTQADDRFLEDASFLRWKNLTIGYVFPKEWMARTRFFSSGKLYVTGRNLLTFTSFRGPDPELPINTSLGANPSTRQFAVGVELKF